METPQASALFRAWWVFVSLIYWPWFLVESTFFCILAMIMWLPVCWSRRLCERAAHRSSCLWGWVSLHTNPLWRFDIEGIERVPKDLVAVYVANHASQIDILALGATFRFFKFISKRSIFFLPVYGWAMWISGYIALSRGDSSSIRRMMDTCVRSLKAGDSLLMYPEGTRSPDGKLQTFKRGAFELARETGVALVPVVIHGSAQALPKGSLLCRPGQIRVCFLAPINADTVRSRDSRELCGDVHTLFVKELAQQ